MRRINRMLILLMLGLTNAMAQPLETGSLSVIEHVEDALQRWEARLEAQATGVNDSEPGAGAQVLNRAQAEAQLVDFKSYLTDIATARKVFEHKLEGQQDALEATLRQTMDSWQPGAPADTAIAADDEPSAPGSDAAPAATQPAVPGSVGKADAGMPMTNSRPIDEGLETELRRQFKAEDDNSLESTLKSLLQDNNQP